MSTKDPPHPDSGNKPFPTTRRSLNPGPPSTSAQVTPLPPAPQGPPSSRRALPPTTITGPLRPPPSLPTVSAPPPLPRMHEGPPSSRAPSIPPPSSSPTTPIPSKSTLPASVQKALVTLDKVKTKLDAIERLKSEPIAIIGMSCRFPGGATSPEAFFKLLEAGADTVTRVSPERWSDDGADSNANPRWGAFLQEDVAMFDAAFFGISPREAERLDPQQRLLLELTWEALERAGQVPASLVGSRTGVFVGLMATDYMLLSMETPPDTWDLYSATGTAHCFPAGRIAYAFGFQGPTMVVDTACSSSLVAVHLAIQSLRAGETDMAIAAGMNLMLSPALFEMTAKTNALSPDGRCKTFDARADGYVRGEGGGVVILKRLSEAQRDGDPVLALLRGSAVNQDGRSTGLTTPNVLSQRAMLEQALASARVNGSEVGYVETHGTGTSLGDPIEFEALRSVLGAPRDDGSTCALGAVKTNIGHLEAAAGIAGLIKTVMVLQREVIPKNLHLRALNPRMSLEGTPFVLPVENRPWDRGEKPRIAGVSSFGLSGTNAHVVVEEAPPEQAEPPPKGPMPPCVLPLSARTPEALVDLARAYSEMLALPEGDSLLDIAYTAGQRRANHEHRLALVGQTRREASTSLAAFVREGSAPGLVRGKASPPGRQRVVFVFPGQGSQWVGMGRQLFREEEAFRASMELCHEAIRRHGTFSLIDEIQADEDTSRLGEIDVVQPMIFAIQVSLAALWQAWGVEPDAVVGHSMGEVAAARAAGILSIEDAAKIICRRSRLLVRIAGQGAMAHVELSAREAQDLIAPHGDALAVAVRNGPRSTVISGDPAAVDDVLATVEARGVFGRRVKVDVASHSPQVDILKEDLAAVLFNLRPRTGRIQMISTVTGEAVRGHDLVADYWVKNLRDPVLFSPVVQRLSEDRPTIFVEIGPHPILTSSVEENLRDSKHGGVAVGSMRRGYDERRALLEAVGTLHVRGAAVDWKRISTPKGGKCVPLPPYAWQRRRYWVLEGPAEDRSRRGPPTSRARGDGMLTLQWHRAEIASAALPSSRAPWLVLSDRGGEGEALAQRLRGLGVPCVRAIVGSRTSPVEPDLWEIDPVDPNGYATLLRDAAPAPFGGVVHMMAMDHCVAASAEAIERAQLVGAESALLLAQAILRRGDAAKLPKLWLVTRGAVPVVAGQPTSVSQAPLWGFGRTLQGEHPDLTTRLLDLPASPWSGEADALVAELFEEQAEDQIALRSDGRFVARVARGGVPTTPLAAALRNDGTYLVTGGLGGLGISFAEWMVGRGARHLVLVGRSAPGAMAQDAIARMEAVGAKIVVASADISVRSEVDTLFERVTKELPPLRGVLHAAAVLDDHTVLKLSVTSMRDVAAAKMYGAWHLHEKTRHLPLDFFVLFASAASLMGSMGQGNYAAANAFLDALAHERRAQGLPAIAIDWGPFAEVGLAAAQSNRGERLSGIGFRSLTPAQGHEILGALLGGAAAQVGVLYIDVERAAQAMPRLATAPVFSALQDAPPRSQSKPQPGPRPLDLLRRTPGADRRGALERIVREEVGKILRLDPSNIDPAEPFAAHGFDSLMALELRNRLQAGFGIQLSMADVVTHTRVDSLATLLEERLQLDAPTIPPPRLPSVAPPPVGSWVVIPKASPKARARLFCFPYAGGAAPVFNAWPGELPPEIELCAIQPPGRHERLHEPALPSVEQMVASLVPALLPYLDRPFACFGHCLGAIVMFEALRVLARDHGKRPLVAFASAAPAPHRYLVPRLSTLSKEAFADVLRSIGFADESLLTDADAQEHMLPAVRSDFEAAARYAFEKGAPLDVPMMAFAGLDDGFAPIDLVDEWRTETTARFSKIAFPGGHYFIVPERAHVLAHVREEVLARLAAAEQMEARPAAAHPPRGPWTLAAAPRTTPIARVICLPGVGQSSLDYARWGAMLGDDVELHMVELPGHGTRVTELPLARVDEIATHVARALQALSDRPFVLFGADLGALVAFEATRLLRRAGERTPSQIVVSSAMAPDTHYFAPIHHHRADRFQLELKRFGIATHAVLDRALRADCAALSSYAFTPEEALDVPIAAFGGEQDHFVPIAAVRGWARHTTAEVTFEARPGGHHLTGEEEARLTALLHQRLAPR